MMHDKAVRSLSALCLGLVCGAFAACAGSDIPPTDAELEAAIAQGYANGSTGTVGGSGGSAGRGGSGGTASSNGGSAQSTAGAAGSGDEPAGGSAGSGGAGGTAGAGGTNAGGACEGYPVLLENCNGPSCHGAGAPYANFAASEEEALSFVGESGTTTCASEGPLLDPENPLQSIIVQKVNGTVPCGGAMPIGSELSEEDIDCLVDWIGSLAD